MADSAASGAPAGAIAATLRLAARHADARAPPPLAPTAAIAWEPTQRDPKLSCWHSRMFASVGGGRLAMLAPAPSAPFAAPIRRAAHTLRDLPAAMLPATLGCGRRRRPQTQCAHGLLPTSPQLLCCGGFPSCPALTPAPAISCPKQKRRPRHPNPPPPNPPPPPPPPAMSLQVGPPSFLTPHPYHPPSTSSPPPPSPLPHTPRWQHQSRANQAGLRAGGRDGRVRGRQDALPAAADH